MKREDAPSEGAQPPVPPEDRLLTLRRVAALTGYDVHSLRRWCAAGRVPGATQPGGYAGSWYVPRRALQQLGVVEVSETPEAVAQPDTLGN
jgi:hypothetical protein